MVKGRLISIEGIDGVGKNTQAKILYEHIKKVKGDCGFFSFPRYETPTGKKIGEHLNRPRLDLDMLGRADLWSVDRWAAKDELNAYLDAGVDVVCDRYIHSNLVYFAQHAELEGHPDPKSISDFICNKEYNEYGIPKVDQLIILSVSPRHYGAMMDSKKSRSYTENKLDFHESNLPLMLGCHKRYNELSNEGSVIVCDFKDELLTIEQISKAVQGAYNYSTRYSTTSLKGKIIFDGDKFILLSSDGTWIAK
jgi:dTMP kinase